MDRLDFAGFRGQHFGKQDLPFGREEAQAALGNSPQLLAGTLQFKHVLIRSKAAEPTLFEWLERRSVPPAHVPSGRFALVDGRPRTGRVWFGEANSTVKLSELTMAGSRNCYWKSYVSLAEHRRATSASSKKTLSFELKHWVICWWKKG